MNIKSLILLLLIFFLQISSTIAYCNKNSDCEHDGTCKNHECKCAVSRYAGDHCQERIENYLGVKYAIYIYVITVASILLCGVCAIKTYWMHKKARKFTVLHLACWFMTVSLFLRSISYLCVIDLKYTRDDQLQPFSGLCYYLFYPFTIGAYSCVLFMWFELYSATTRTKIENLPRYRKMYIAVNAIMFPVELVVRVVSTVYRDTSIAYLMWGIYLVYFGSVFLIEAGGFIIIACLVLRKLARSTALTGSETTQRALLKISKTLLLLSFIMILILIILILFSTAETPTGFYVLIWICKVAEYSIVLLLLYIVQPPQDDVASTQHTDFQLSRTGSGQSTDRL